MPELPEVETVRRGLAPVMEGAVIDEVEQRRADLRVAVPAALRPAADRAHGRRASAGAPNTSSPTSTTATCSSCISACRARSASRPTAATADRRRATITPRSKLRAHDHVVFHMSSGRARRLQRSAPLRPDGPRAARATSTTSKHFTRHRHRAARQRARRRRRSPRLLRGPHRAAQGGADGPAADRRARQHLCLRGAVAGAAVARPRRRARSPRKTGTPTRGGRPARRGDPRGARGGDRRRRLVAPRPHPRRRASSATSSTPSRSTTARASPARGRTAAASSAAWSSPAARPSIVRSASAEGAIETWPSRTILVETRGAVGADHAQPAEGAERAQRGADRRTGRGARRLRGGPRRSARSSSPARRRPSPPAPTSRRWRSLTFVEAYLARSRRRRSTASAEIAEADHRRGRRLLPRRRLRARHDVRHRHRRRHREIRPAGDHARHHARASAARSACRAPSARPRRWT